MGLSRFIANQLGNPSGLFGRHVMTRLLNRGNDELISGAMASLELKANDRFLDVGFGGGVGILKAARVITHGTLAGVDRSDDVVRHANQRLKALVNAGQLLLQTADVTALPWADHSFDKLLTTNTVYFWPDLQAGLRECARVLAPGGRIAIGISGEDKMRGYGRVTRHGFRLFRGTELSTELSALGLVDTRVIALHGRYSYGDFVIVGDKTSQ